MTTRRLAKTALVLVALGLTTGTAPLGPPTVVQQQGSAAAAVRADKGPNGGLTVRLSGVVTITLSVEGSPPLEVTPDRRVTDSTAWKVKEVFPATTLPLGNGRVRWEQTIQLAPLDKGEQPLALAPLRFRENQQEWHSVTWQPFACTVTTAINRVDLGEARDITDIEHLPPVRPWWELPLGIGLGLLVGVLAVSVGFLMRRWRRFAPVLTPDQAALRELGRLTALKLPGAGRVERFHTMLSNILRRYLERRFQVPARRQTTAEFLEALRQGPELTPAQQALLRDFLERCDLAKFAGITPSLEECQAVADMARTLVEQTTASPHA
jgi:hypothetical protein